MGNTKGKSLDKIIKTELQSYINSFKTDNNNLLQFYIINNFYEEIEPLLNDISETNLKNIAKKISSFCFSEKFFIYLLGEFKNENPAQPLSDFIFWFENKEKYLSLKLLFYLLEEIKTEKFEKQIQEFKQLKTEPKSLEKSYYIYFEKHKDELMEIRNNLNKVNDSKFTIIISQYLNEQTFKQTHYLYILYMYIIIMVFNEVFIKELSKENKKDDNNQNVFYENIKILFQDKNEFNNIINILTQLNSLNKTKFVQQIFLFYLNVLKNEKQILLKDTFDKTFFEDYKGINFNNNQLVFTLYEEDTNNTQNDKKYIRTKLIGKKTEKEKYYFDILDSVSKITINNDVEGISGSIFESLLYYKAILIIKIDSLKKKKSTLEEIKNEIILFQDSCPLGYNNLDTYIQFENQIINLDSSYDLFIELLKEKNIIDNNNKINIENNSNIIINNINDNEHNNANLSETELELKKEKERNKILEDKIKKLESELAEEKNKNKNVGEVSNIRNELDKEIKKYNDLKTQIEEEKTMKINLGNESKESMIETIIEKDKEIKELKLKLSRLPFILEEGESLLSITFITPDQHLRYSVICKNTDEFHKVEGQLYKKYPEYSENENFFIVDGRKINKYKTIEENRIKNSAIILLNSVE